MKCPKCNKKVDDKFRFCPYCGVQIEIPKGIPKPKRLSDGTYSGQIRVNGERFSIKGKTIDEYYALANAYKQGIIKTEKEQIGEPIYLMDIVDKYIDINRNILSASVIRSYDSYSRTMFADAMYCDIRVIDWQKMVNLELKDKTVKTVKNYWSLISSSFKYSGFDVPVVRFPRQENAELRFLTFEQIQVLLDAMRGSKYELATILALHGLRTSELLALTREDIYDNTIHINKSLVRDTYGNMVLQKKNKTKLSTRDVPVFIDRLYELLPESGILVPYTNVAIYHAIQRACEKYGLPPCGVHDMRRSFASLCYHKEIDIRHVMKLGGWSSPAVLQQVYIKLYDQDVAKSVQKLRDDFNPPTDR